MDLCHRPVYRLQVCQQPGRGCRSHGAPGGQPRRRPLDDDAFFSASYGYFILPTYASDLACIGFDRSGTTRIGKFIINHSFIIPGLIGVGTGCGVGYLLVTLLLKIAAGILPFPVTGEGL